MDKATTVAGWGIKPPDETRPHFGARAIFDARGGVSLVGDRMGWGGEPGPEREALRAFMKAKGDALMRKMAKGLAPSEPTRLEACEDGFVVAVSPQASHGYLYIGAWKVL